MKKIAILLIVVINAAAYLLLATPLSIRQEPIRIAVVGPLEAFSGKAMRQGVELYQEQINAQGGIDGRDIELLFYNDYNKPETAQTIATEIANENKVLMVIGHYYSSASAAAGKIYKRNGIPAITASATTESVTHNNDWYFRIIPDSALEAQFAANYIKTGFKQQTASIIYSKDEYGESLARNFTQTIEQLGMKMAGKWTWDNDKAPQKQLKTITQELAAIDNPGFIYLATHSAEGAKMLTAFKDAAHSYSIIGCYAFGRSFLAELKHYDRERSEPGYYSDGVYFLSPFMISIGGAGVFRFREQFRRKYYQYPDMLSACYYDSIHVGLRAIKMNGIQGIKQIREDRKKIRETLAGFYNEAHAIQGITGLLWFDENGSVKRHYAVGVWQNQKPKPAFLQYLQKTGEIDNMIQTALDGGVILANDIVMHQTRVVYVNVDDIEVSAIDAQKAEFTAAFNLRFRYHGAFNDTDIEFGNSITPVLLDKPIQTDVKDGVTAKLYRVKARFRADFDFSSFPMDQRQILPIRFRHKLQTDDKLIYIPDSHSTKLNGHAFDWKVNQVEFYQDILSKQTTLGSPRFFNSRHKLGYSQFNAEIIIRRVSPARIIALNFLPVFLGLLSLCLLFYIPIHQLFKRLLLIVTVFMIGVTGYVIKLTDLPLSYVTVMDYAYFLMIGLTIIAAGVSLLSTRFSRGPS